MRTRLLPFILVATLAGLAVWAMLRTRASEVGPRVFQHEPVGVMGTSCRLVLLSEHNRAQSAQRKLAAAEAELRRLETLLSTWIDLSPVSRLNGAAAGEPLEIPTELEQVLRLSAALYDQTSGAFDITARPLIELWRQAARDGRAPTSSQIADARDASSWQQVDIEAGQVSKSRASTRVDIDGVAKGFAIDRATEVLAASGSDGGMVEVGGDLRVFGAGPEGGPWTVAIRSPFEERAWAEIELVEGAVCSSGDYARYLEIGGRRYSQIIDPRTGAPTAATHSVTVVGPDAATADAWATALSVLGADGLDLLAGTELEALVVEGDPESYRVEATAGFRDLLVGAAFELED